MPPSSATALQSLTDYNTTRKSAKDITTEAQSQYGIPEYNQRLSSLRGLVGNLQSSVEAVDPSVTGRTSGSFVTEGQRSALVNKEQQPILGSLAKEQGALGQEQEGYQNASGLATQLATAMISGDQTKYQSLLDQYNAAVAAEKAAEDKRQFEATLAEQKRQADLTAKTAAGSASGYNLGGLGNNATTAAADPLKQRAQADVSNLLTKDGARIQQEYNAIKKSAGFGNSYDQLKLQLLDALNPRLKSGGATTSSGGGLQVAPVRNPKLV